MFTSDTLLVAVAVVLRILVTAGILAPCARYILQVRPTPYGRSLLIAAAGQLLAKGADELLRWPLEVVGLIPGLVMLVPRGPLGAVRCDVPVRGLDAGLGRASLPPGPRWERSGQ